MALDPGVTTTYDLSGCVSWHDDMENSHMTERRLVAVKHHQATERAWNHVLTSVVNSSFLFTPPPSLPEITDITVGEETDLWQHSLADGSRFREVPLQRELVEMVLRRTKGDQWNRAQRNGIGTHIPDMCTLLSSQKVDGLQPPLGLISPVIEIKVTKIESRNGHFVVAIGARDDPEVQHDDSTHYSVPSAAGDEELMLKLDGEKKWTAGLAKEVVYIQSAYEYCHARLGAFILGTRLSRIVLAANGCVILECSSAFLDRVHQLDMPMTEFLRNPHNVSHLRWDLASPVSDTTSAAVQWDREALDKLVDIHRLGVDILQHQTADKPDNPFVPLTDPLEHPGVKAIVDELTAGGSVSATLGTGSQHRPSNDDDDKEPNRKPAHEKKPRTQQGKHAGPPHPSTSTPPRERFGSGPSGARAEGKAQEETSSLTTAARWRLDVALASPAAVPETTPDSSFEVKTPSTLPTSSTLPTPPTTIFDEQLMNKASGVDASVYSSDLGADWDEVLEANDLCPSDTSWVRNYVAPDSDLDEEEEGRENVLYEDMLAVIGKLGMTVRLVDSAAMDRLLGAIAAAVA